MSSCTNRDAVDSAKSPAAVVANTSSLSINNRITTVVRFFMFLPAGGRVQAFGWLVGVGSLLLQGELPLMRSEGWTLETVGDWGMLGRVRDLASRGLCSFLSSDLCGNSVHVNCRVFLSFTQSSDKLWNPFFAQTALLH